MLFLKSNTQGYQEFVTNKHSNLNQVYDTGTQNFGNFHINVQQMTGSFNGHTLPSDVARQHHSPEEGTNADNAHRHQIMNNRLKSLIQSRQTQKEITTGQNHGSFAQPNTQQFAG